FSARQLIKAGVGAVVASERRDQDERRKRQRQTRRRDRLPARHVQRKGVERLGAAQVCERVFDLLSAERGGNGASLRTATEELERGDRAFAQPKSRIDLD